MKEFTTPHVSDQRIKIVVHTAGGRIEVEIPVRQAQQDPG
jgi:hypothetical protein